MNPESLWVQAGACFDTDDGSLPGVLVENLSASGLAEVYAMLRRRSRPEGNPAEFWDIERAEAVPVDSVPNAATLVASGQAEPFHMLIGGLGSRGVELPSLGVFVWRDAVELDYRMGPDWGPAEVAGFFELLKDCCELDPAARVVPEDSEGPPYSGRFADAWAAYRRADRD